MQLLFLLLFELVPPHKEHVFYNFFLKYVCKDKEGYCSFRNGQGSIPHLRVSATPAPHLSSSAEVADQHTTIFFSSYHHIKQNSSFIWCIYALEDNPLSGIITVWSS